MKVGAAWSWRHWTVGFSFPGYMIGLFIGPLLLWVQYGDYQRPREGGSPAGGGR